MSAFFLSEYRSLTTKHTTDKAYQFIDTDIGGYFYITLIGHALSIVLWAYIECFLTTLSLSKIVDLSD